MSSLELKLDTKHSGFYWLLLAGLVVQITVALSIFFIGRAGWLSAHINRQGVGLFASDSYNYMLESVKLVRLLHDGDVRAWLVAPLALHVKLYSLSFYVLYPFFGATILSAELVNLSFYCMTLLLVYLIGKDIFDRQAGLLAATVVGLWPSFLLHTTQMLKTTLIIVGILAVVLVNTRWIVRRQRFLNALLHIGMGLSALMTLWMVRSGRWFLFTIIIFLGLAGSATKMIVERRMMFWNLAGITIMLVTIIALPILFPPWIPPSSSPFAVHDEHPKGLWDTMLLEADTASARIGMMREGFFLDYSNSGSLINNGYHIRNLTDLLCFIPRATVIGFLAPFPNMWFEEGTLGFSTRLLSGLETLTMYGIMFFAAIGFWHKRRSFVVWYLLAVAFIGAVTLGLVVVNIGALYRMRYAYWMFLVVIGAGGFQEVVLPWLRSRLKGKWIIPG